MSLLAAPDLSTAGSISDFHSPGYKFGVAVNYGLSEKLSITGGIVQSSVRYAASGRYYNPEDQYNYPIINPDWVTAHCLILDIPVNLKYDVFLFDRSRIFTSAGLSSYFMQSEEYDFDYSEDNARLIRQHTEKSGDVHLFSNAGFSIGYEFDVHPNWSLQVEPFIRVPLREVGWANVNLYSMGSFFSLNYKL